MIDYLIVGAGFYGATVAKSLYQRGKTVVVLEKDQRVGGHAQTESMDGILIHKYGPHVFHTSEDRIWHFVTKFADFNNYQLKVKVNYKDQLFSFPINLLTLHQVYGVTNPEDARKAIQNDIVPNETPKNFEEAALASVGKRLYEIFYHGYTSKQWGCDPKELSPTLFNRLPIRLNFHDGYFTKYRDKYQGVPICGYTELVERILDGVPVIQGDYLENKSFWKRQARKIIFTGPPDALFDYTYGVLPYRSLRFEHEIYNVADYQGSAVINYTDKSVPWTRITEHKHFDAERYASGSYTKTIITKEFPTEYKAGGEAFYPINNVGNNATFERYKALAEKEGYLLGGRLGMYKYLDMDQTIANALELVESL